MNSAQLCFLVPNVFQFYDICWCGFKTINQQGINLNVKFNVLKKSAVKCTVEANRLKRVNV